MQNASVSLEANHDTRCQFVIRPNQSMSWWGNSSVFLSLALLSSAIVGFFAAQGLWMIAPFSGVELIFVGVMLHLVWRKTKTKETITITGNEVIVRRGINKPEQCHTFPRGWVQVVLTPAQLPSHPSKLWLRSHGRQIEIGTCLNDTERKQLAKEIRHRIQQFNQSDNDK